MNTDFFTPVGGFQNKLGIRQPTIVSPQNKVFFLFPPRGEGGGGIEGGGGGAGGGGAGNNLVGHDISPALHPRIGGLSGENPWASGEPMEHKEHTRFRGRFKQKTKRNKTQKYENEPQNRARHSIANIIFGKNISEIRTTLRSNNSHSSPCRSRKNLDKRRSRAKRVPWAVTRTRGIRHVFTHKVGYLRNTKTEENTTYGKQYTQTSLQKIMEKNRMIQKHNGIFGSYSFTLGNGMQVIVVENHRLPLVHHWLWYKTGSADSPAEKSGLAHYLEHLMFKNTIYEKFSKTITKLGGSYNAFTDHDYTAYYVSITSRYLEQIMEMEAGRMISMEISEEDCINEKNVILEERYSYIDNEPLEEFREYLMLSVFNRHPYRNPVIGWHNEIESYTPEDALSFHDKWYAPNNSILVLVGDVTPEEAFSLTERIYGKIEPRIIPERTRPKEIPMPGGRRFDLQHMRVVQPVIEMVWRIPFGFSGNIRKCCALRILGEVMGGNSSSRLHNLLVVEKNLATVAGTYWNEITLDGYVFTTVANLFPHASVEEAETVIIEEIEKIISDGFTEKEINDIKKSVLRSIPCIKDSGDAVCSWLGKVLAVDGTPDDIEQYCEHMEKTTVDDVNEVAKEILKLDSMTIGKVVPGDNL